MFNLFKKTIEKTNAIKPVVLLVIDGFGVAPDSKGNAITRAKTPNFDKWSKQYPNGAIIASGESVGLPANEVGNSEVGHLTIGAGRVVLQSILKINRAIEEEKFNSNEAFTKAHEHVKKNNSTLHIAGIASSGEVHGSPKHLHALIEWCYKAQIDFCLHLFTDGRDAPPDNGLETIKVIQAILDEQNKSSNTKGQIATVCGRYYAMDRDTHWERTAKAYKAMVEGVGETGTSASQIIQSSYSNEKSDEFVEPSKVAGTKLVSEGDALIFYNFRIDRARQLAIAFVIDRLSSGNIEKKNQTGGSLAEGTGAGWEEIKNAKHPNDLFVVSMTEYQKGLPVDACAFVPDPVDDGLTQILASNNLKQLHLSESEKTRMVTFYFDGITDKKVPGEDVIVIPSPKVDTFDKKPEMSVFELVAEFKRQLDRDIYHFFVINLANPDMVAHSGDVKATIKAVEYVDKATGELVNSVLEVGGVVVITADHGNAEELLTFPSSSYFYTTKEGGVNTEHSNNPVPIYLIGNQFAGKSINFSMGNLTDIAPTVLSLVGLPIPTEMTGSSYIKTSSQ